ncbi:hypothetical protein HN51_010791, partial [Arachis hypogaea]
MQRPAESPGIRYIKNCIDVPRRDDVLHSRTQKHLQHEQDEMPPKLNPVIFSIQSALVFSPPGGIPNRRSNSSAPMRITPSATLK